jgi:hypothetical protein
LLTPVILAIVEAEIRRTVVRNQPGQTVRETLSRKTIHKNRAGGVAPGVGREFKPQYLKKKRVVILSLARIPPDALIPQPMT